MDSGGSSIPDWRGRRVIFNSGAKPGASSALWIVPADRVAVAIVANQMGAPVNQLAGEILASALGLEPAAAAAPAAPAPAGPKAAPPPLPPPGPELRGQWRGTISSCPRTLKFSLDIRGTHDLIATLGDDAPQVAEAGAAARGEASGTLKPSADMASSTLEFDLFVKDDHLEGPVKRYDALKVVPDAFAVDLSASPCSATSANPCVAEPSQHRDHARP